LLVNRVVSRQGDVEQKVEASECRENSHVTHSDPSASICNWKGTAGSGVLQRSPTVFQEHEFAVDFPTSRSRKGWIERHLKYCER
jgi:hypothetical protein